MTRRLAALASLLIVVGCAPQMMNTRVGITAFSDPAFQKVLYLDLIVAAPNLLPENAVYFEREMCAALQGLVAKCRGASPMFPPTRQYTADDIVAILEQSGADAALFLNVLSDNSSSQYVGTYATANPSGWGYAIPLIRRDRGARAGVQLQDLKSWKAAWAGQLIAEGRGAGTSDAALISAGAKEIAAELQRAGHVASATPR